MVFNSVNSGRMGRGIMMEEKHVVEAAHPITDRKLRERQLQPPSPHWPWLGPTTCFLSLTQDANYKSIVMIRILTV